MESLDSLFEGQRAKKGKNRGGRVESGPWRLQKRSSGLKGRPGHWGQYFSTAPVAAGSGPSFGQKREPGGSEAPQIGQITGSPATAGTSGASRGRVTPPRRPA